MTVAKNRGKLIFRHKTAMEVHKCIVILLNISGRFSTHTFQTETNY